MPAFFRPHLITSLSSQLYQGQQKHSGVCFLYSVFLLSYGKDCISNSFPWRESQLHIINY